MRRTLALAALALAGCGEVAAPPPPAPEGTLFLAGREPGTLIRVDTATGEVTRHEPPGLGPGDPPYMVHFTGGRLVTFALGRTTSFTPDVSTPQNLGEAWFFVPSATPGRVWNILLEQGTNIRFRGVREVTVDGRPTFARRARVPGWPLAAAVPGGLLLQRKTLRLWDPASGRVTRVPGVFPRAVHGSLVASCAQRCRRIHLFDTRTGADATVRFANATEGAFSPDGKLLAVRDEPGRIAVIDVERRTVREVTRAPADYPLLAWASSGWLFYNAGGGRLGAWRPNEPARVLPMNVGPFVDMTSD
jgi:hypothetical protein